MIPVLSLTADMVARAAVLGAGGTADNLTDMKGLQWKAVFTTVLRRETRMGKDWRRHGRITRVGHRSLSPS